MREYGRGAGTAGAAGDSVPGGLNAARKAGGRTPRAPRAPGAAHKEAVSLDGRKILIVEDEFFVALAVEEALQDIGCVTVGPISDLSEAMKAARREVLDAAVLDINLDGVMVYPLAEELMARGIPFVFATGYSGGDLPIPFRDAPRIQKPFHAHTLQAVIRRIVRR